LYRDDGSGSLDANDTFLSNVTLTGNGVGLSANEDLIGPATYWIQTTWTNRTPASTFGLSVTDVRSNGSASFRPAEQGLVYLLAAPTGLQVDGAFGDWQGRPYGQDLLGDVTNKTGSLAYDANVDLLATAVDLGANFLNLTSGYRVVFFASDWRLEFDCGLPDAVVARFPVVIQAATNVVINEVSPRPNPEWAELANPLATSVSLNGWVLQVQSAGP